MVVVDVAVVADDDDVAVAVVDVVVGVDVGFVVGIAVDVCRVVVDEDI